MQRREEVETSDGPRPLNEFRFLESFSSSNRLNVKAYVGIQTCIFHLPESKPKFLVRIQKNRAHVSLACLKIYRPETKERSPAKPFVVGCCLHLRRQRLYGTLCREALGLSRGHSCKTVAAVVTCCSIPITYVPDTTRG